MVALPPQWFPEHDEMKPLARALLYPYPAPTGDFYMQDGVLCLVPEGIRADKLRGRIPVLGVGSNRAPLQLRRKFKKKGFVPVTAAILHGADVVFAAHLSSYCAVAATAVASEGTRVTLNIAWLNKDQLKVMDKSEGLKSAGEGSKSAYNRICYNEGVVTHGCRPDGDDEVFNQPIYGYESHKGVLGIDGKAVAHTDIGAEDRHLCEMNQRMMFEKLRSLLSGDDMSVEKWINHMLKYECQRRVCADAIEDMALKPMPNPWEVVDVKICDLYNQ